MYILIRRVERRSGRRKEELRGTEKGIETARDPEWGRGSDERGTKNGENQSLTLLTSLFHTGSHQVSAFP